MNLSDAFSMFKKSAKRLELFQEYHMEGQEWDSFHMYLSGKYVPIFDDLSEWNNQLLEYKSQGKTVERIRLIKSPVSSYLRFEIDLGYLPSSLCGQKVKFISEMDFKLLNKDNLKNDFWIFDDEIVFEMLYDEKGAFYGSKQVEGRLEKELYSRLCEKAKPLEMVTRQMRLHPLEINFDD